MKQLEIQGAQVIPCSFCHGLENGQPGTGKYPAAAEKRRVKDDKDGDDLVSLRRRQHDIGL